MNNQSESKTFVKSYIIGNVGQKVVFLNVGPNEDESWNSIEEAQASVDKANARYAEQENPEWTFFLSNHSGGEM